MALQALLDVARNRGTLPVGLIEREEHDAGVGIGRRQSRRSPERTYPTATESLK